MLKAPLSGGEYIQWEVLQVKFMFPRDVAWALALLISGDMPRQILCRNAMPPLVMNKARSYCSECYCNFSHKYFQHFCVSSPLLKMPCLKEL